MDRVPVSRVGSCGLQSMGSLPTEVTSGVLLDAPTIFSAWINSGFPSSFCVVDTSANPDPFWPDADWVGRYGPAPVPAGSGSGFITVTNGDVLININMASAPSNGSYACDPMTHGNHGCISQTLTCNGTAFVPEFVQ